MKLLIAGAAIFIHLPAGASPCEAPLRADFPIEKFYRHVHIGIGKGHLQLNRGSRAFVLWRQKTPLYIPDEAFVFQYLSAEQRARRARELLREQAEGDHFKATIITPEAMASKFKAVGAMLQASASDEILKQAIYDLSHPKWIVFRQKSQWGVIFFFDDSHFNVAHELRRRNPELETISGGSVGTNIKAIDGKLQVLEYHDLENLAAMGNENISDELNEDALEVLFRALFLAYPGSENANFIFSAGAELPPSLRVINQSR